MLLFIITLAAVSNKPQIPQWLDAVKFISPSGNSPAQLLLTSRWASTWWVRIPGLSRLAALPNTRLWRPLHFASAQGKERMEKAHLILKLRWQQVTHLDATYIPLARTSRMVPPSARGLGNIVPTGQPLSPHNFRVKKRKNKYTRVVFPPLPYYLFLSTSLPHNQLKPWLVTV